MLRTELSTKNLLPDRLNGIGQQRLRILLEYTTQGAKWRDSLVVPLPNGRKHLAQPRRTDFTVASVSEPTAKQDQVDVSAISVL